MTAASWAHPLPDFDVDDWTTDLFGFWKVDVWTVDRRCPRTIGTRRCSRPTPSPHEPYCELHQEQEAA